MTTIASYFSLSEAGKKTLTMISDSRITWVDNTSKQIVSSYDYSQKIFKLENSLDIFGYCGDSLFCLSNISQIISYLRTSQEYINALSIYRKITIIYEIINNSLSDYPESEIRQNFTVYLNTIFNNQFYSHKFFFMKDTGCFDHEKIEIPFTTGLVFKGGSGETLYGNILSKYLSELYPKARNYFKALVELIENQTDPKTGGPPQMCCLNLEKKSILSVGVLFNEKFYINGVHDLYLSDTEKVEFRDENFNFLTPDGKVRNNYKGSYRKK